MKVAENIHYKYNMREVKSITRHALGVKYIAHFRRRREKLHYSDLVKVNPLKLPAC